MVTSAGPVVPSVNKACVCLGLYPSGSIANGAECPREATPVNFTQSPCFERDAGPDKDDVACVQPFIRVNEQAEDILALHYSTIFL